MRCARFTAAGVLLALGVALLLSGFAEVQSHIQRRNLGAEVQHLASKPFDPEPGKPVIVVTGSSTVRLWPGSAEAFPDAEVVNTGFGGSTMAALEEHYADLIGRYEPQQIFIGSGDNDLALGRSAEEVSADTEGLLQLIRTDLPGAQVAIIAAKPSVRRWYLRDRYQELNARFQELADAHPGVVYVDVWNRLLDPTGWIRPELYADDGLHLNRKGYRIYAAALGSANKHGEGAASE